jgi:hypothetical protein
MKLKASPYPKRVWRICKVCGKDFWEPEGWNAFYCTRQCANRIEYDDEGNLFLDGQPAGGQLAGG